MNILVTGAKGMVGTALCNNLKNIRDGKNKTRPALQIEEIFEYDLDSTPAELDEYCQKSDFVFNLAGVNRPENPEDFMKGNFGFASELLNCPEKAQQQGNGHAILLHSSHAGRSLRQQRVRPQQESWRGAVLPVCSGDRRKGCGLPLCEPDGTQPPQVQQCRQHLLLGSRQ